MHAPAYICALSAPLTGGPGNSGKQVPLPSRAISSVKPAAPSAESRSGPTTRATKTGGKWCASCAGKGAVECPGCKGSGKNKKNGNVFERWKCYDCQGFGLISCKKCGAGGRGLTPEQRGER